MTYRYKVIMANTLQQVKALQINNRSINYIIMNKGTRDFLREHLSEEFIYNFLGVYKMFGYKILVDDDLKDDEIKVVGDYRRWN